MSQGMWVISGGSKGRKSLHKGNSPPDTLILDVSAVTFDFCKRVNCIFSH